MNRDIYKKINVSARESNSQIYLVGGCVRDLILGRALFDIDLLVYGQKRFVELLHKRIPSALICLDRGRAIYRLALKGSVFTIDITLEDADVTLYQNLNKRDFTFNAMAIKAEDASDYKENDYERLIDPFNGREDIARKIVRMVREDNFVDDPLRLLRAFRFAAQFGFDLDKKTLEQISHKAELINKVARERIHSEWIKLLESAYTASYIRKMKDCKLLAQFFPEIESMEGLEQGENHVHTLWEHSLATLLHLEEMLNGETGDLTPRLITLVEGVKIDKTSCIPLIKMAALFHDVAKPLVKARGGRDQVVFFRHPEKGVDLLKDRLSGLRFSKTEIKLITRLVQNHMRPLLLSLANKLSKKAVTKLFVDSGDTWQELLLLSLADKKATDSRDEKTTPFILFIDSLYSLLVQVGEKSSKAPLITGKELQENLKFPPGPFMGKVLMSINNSFLSGSIKTKQEALKMARHQLMRAAKKVHKGL